MISLKISEIHSKDWGKGYARISSLDMKELGLTSWDLIQIDGRKKTVVRALPLDIDEEETESVIEIDTVTRENAGVGLDDIVIVTKADLEKASRITLCPRDKAFLYDPAKSKRLSNRLEGLAVTVGDRVSVRVSAAKTEDFDVLTAMPEHSVIISQKTRMDVIQRPKTKVDAERISYADIGGLLSQIKRIKEILEFPIRFPSLFEKLGVQPPRGVLLTGPPGSGKTLLAKAIAFETNSNFQVINGPEIIHRFYGESEAKLRQIFEAATKNQPSIIFLDELDAIAPRRDKVTGDVEKRVVAQLLSLMDGLTNRGNVTVIGATNLPDMLDPALRRPGRFDREIHLPVPDTKARLEIFQVHSRSMPLSNDVDLQRLSELSSGYVGADIENLCREAAINSLTNILPDMEEDSASDFGQSFPVEVSMENFLEALRNIHPSAIREIVAEIPKTSWEDVGGLENVKNDLIESVIWPMKHRNFYEALDVTSPRGIMLHGPPGTGKTLLAKALANRTEVNFISIKGAELLSKYVGESERAVREVFRKAKQVSPCIVFFDEIDALCPRRSESNSTRVSERVVSQLLAEIDGVEELPDVLVLAATNRIDMVEPALLRPGRFDLVVEVPAPSKQEILEILKIHTWKKPLGTDIKISALAEQLEGRTGADVKLVCNRASLHAIKEHLGKNKKVIKLCKRHFDLALAELQKRSGYREE
ncbi:MAG: AAA family ATPase [Candidatus Dadabacteria bacterium]|nr:AAA family ATPase [Candidatus Dadabacteria bacterium]MYA48155.1 AAA family ATPase [Candidatus Dadabacteria bacterium]MYG83587.1 AAA family ATPase [Candidatus Dadabacteria bacterium]MYK49667.1 AAA family ATPase [Candidatus Dadabacteria bacterium]